MIHVAYRLWGGDGFFAKMLGTSMLSMFENTKEKVTVHIMHNDRLTPDNYGKFCYIAGQYNQQVDFRNVETIAGDTLRKFEAVHPMKSGINAAWYPLVTHEVFPDLDKIIFLGADTVFNLDINDMWSFELKKELPFGAVSEYFLKKSVVNPICQDGYVRHEDYFNTDVLIFDPNLFRKDFEKVLEACQFVGQHKEKYRNAENDALALLYYKDYTRLPDNFNMMINHLYIHRPQPHYNLEKALYHFSDSNYRMTLNTDNVFNRLYFEHFLKTPWANADMFGNLNRTLDTMFRQVQNSSRNALLHFTNLLTERQRAFFVDSKLLNDTKRIFKVKDNEFVMEASPNIKKLIRELNASKGKKVFFLFINNYWETRKLLIEKNFVEGLDFVNGFVFLSENYGIRLNFDSKPIVREL